MPSDIPVAVNVYYKGKGKGKGWKGMGDWLGTGRIADHLKEYRDFKEARAFVRSQNLKNQAEWISFTKTKGMPSDLHPI